MYSDYIQTSSSISSQIRPHLSILPPALCPLLFKAYQVHLCSPNNPEAITNSPSPRVEASCPPLPSMLGFYLAWLVQILYI